MAPYLQRTQVSLPGRVLRGLLLAVALCLALSGTREQLREPQRHGWVVRIATLPVVMLSLGFALGRLLTLDERSTL